jgi:phage replication O-like protein O
MAVPPVTRSNKPNLPDLSETNLKPGEGNFTRIRTSIWEALSKVNLSPYESRLVDVVVRKTFGWNKVRAWISLSQFEQMSGIQRWNVQKVLKRLIEKRIIIRTEHGQRMVYEINQNFAEWKGYPNRTDLVTSP